MTYRLKDNSEIAVSRREATNSSLRLFGKEPNNMNDSFEQFSEVYNTVMEDALNTRISARDYETLIDTAINSNPELKHNALISYAMPLDVYDDEHWVKVYTQFATRGYDIRENTLHSSTGYGPNFKPFIFKKESNGELVFYDMPIFDDGMLSGKSYLELCVDKPSMLYQVHSYHAEYIESRLREGLELALEDLRSKGIDYKVEE